MCRMIKGAQWTWETVLYLCRLSTENWDKFMAGLDVYGASDVRAAANRTEIMARAMVREQGKGDFKYWLEDAEAEEWSGDLPLDVAKGVVRGRGLRMSAEHLQRNLVPEGVVDGDGAMPAERVADPAERVLVVQPACVWNGAK